MKPADLIELLLLAALWGASFLFMRIAAPVFGPVPLIAVRVAVATACLLPLLAWRGGLQPLVASPGLMLVVGLLNSALPFICFAYATLSITAGFTSILNATTPMFGALVGWLWLKDKLSWLRIVGLLVGFSGIVVLVWGKVSFKPGGSGLAIVACLSATLMYGIAANHTKRYLTGVPALAIATGTQLSSALVLAPFAWWWWPAQAPTTTAWTAAILLGVFCTGIAYVLYFRLIARLGPAKAISVTFLIPLFASLWGVLWLAEPVTTAMFAGGGVVLLGTALTTGVIGNGWRPWPARPAARSAD
ncbi:DMT family transporter [Chitinivorax sp. PXF-14]|uniref:DMT family transporter n=1 Tax=Chitinivorax sp. PXF-14 TaxID=3230488 RepID=UPI003465AE40